MIVAAILMARLTAGSSEGKMAGFQSKHRSAQEIEIAELRNSLAQAKQKKTLRDEFAIAALVGTISKYGSLTAGDVAEDAYAIADAMMKERMK